MISERRTLPHAQLGPTSYLAKIRHQVVIFLHVQHKLILPCKGVAGLLSFLQADPAMLPKTRPAGRGPILQSWPKTATLHIPVLTFVI
jgi:hypothetical protein